MIVSLCAALLLAAAPVLASGGDFTIDFVAAAPHSYNHANGGGAYNDGTVGVDGDIVNSLQGGDFQAGDLVSWLVLITVQPGATGKQTIELDFSFAAGNTGHSGAMIAGVNRPRVNREEDDDAVVVLNGQSASDFAAGKEPVRNAKGTDWICGISITDLDAGEKIVIRIDTPLSRDLGSNPTGNLYGQIDSGKVLEPPVSPKVDTINTGKKNVPFQKVGEILPAAIGIVKKATDDLTATEPPATKSTPTVGPGTTVEYWFTVSNPGSSPLRNVTLYDVFITETGTEIGDHIPLDLSGVLSDTDSDGLNDDLPAGTSVNVSMSYALGSTPGTVYNRAVASGFDPSRNQTVNASDTAQVTIQAAANAAPVANNDSYGTDEDTALTVDAPGVLDNDTDADGDALTAVWVSDPAHGTLTLNADGSFTYTPSANYSGSDSFTYKAYDGALYSNEATVTITIDPINDPPVAVDDDYETNEDTELTVSAAEGVLSNDTDAEGDTLSAVLVDGPTHGTLTLNANGSFTYTPSANYSGTDSFTYKANDGSLDSVDPATVTITVVPVNDPPVAANDTFQTEQNTTLTISAPGVIGTAGGGQDTDVDGDSLSIDIADVLSHTEPTYGILTLNSDGSFTYVPNTDFAGYDSFTYRVTDGQASSNYATVTITVIATNIRSIQVRMDSRTLTNSNTHLEGSFTIFNTSSGGYSVQVTDFRLQVEYKPVGDKKWYPADVISLDFDPDKPPPYFEIDGNGSMPATFSCDLSVTDPSLLIGATIKVTVGVQIASRPHGAHEFSWYESSM